MIQHDFIYSCMYFEVPDIFRKLDLNIEKDGRIMIIESYPYPEVSYFLLSCRYSKVDILLSYLDLTNRFTRMHGAPVPLSNYS